MTPADIRTTRRALRKPDGRPLTQAEFGQLLGLRGTARNAGRQVRRLESGEAYLTGPVATAMTYLGQGALDDDMRAVLPEHLIADAEGGDSLPEFVIRLWWPRFVAIVCDESRAYHLAGALDSIAVAPGEWLVVVMWIDEPRFHDAEALLARAATALEIYTQDSFAGDILENDT